MAQYDKVDVTTRDMILSQLGVGQKVYNVYDANSRLIEVYEAPLTAQTGDPCLKTIIKYIDGAGGTSRLILATSEELAAWDSAWDTSNLP